MGWGYQNPFSGHDHHNYNFYRSLSYVKKWWMLKYRGDSGLAIVAIFFLIIIMELEVYGTQMNNIVLITS
jgi:hypothetical protein